MSRLSITRRVGERIFIEEDSIKVLITGVKGNQVKLVIEAPKEVSIHREEIYRKIEAERAANTVEDLEVPNDSIDEELMSQLLRKFGRCANDDAISDTKVH